ncbi:MFS transporter [Candidatus Roizmanbacteria bacterium]|nr:MFS transporter [Candidatus Roizmanbacteria bacterium]
MNLQLILLYILHIFNDGYQAAFLILLPFIAKDLHINLTQVGSLGSVIYIMEMVFSLPAGYLASRFDGLKILTVLMFLFGIGFSGLFFTSSLSTLLFPFLFVGVAYGIFHPIGFSLVAKWAKTHTRGRQLGDFTAIGDIGRITLPAIITYLVVLIGWKSTSLGFGISAFVLFFIAFMLYHSHKKIQTKVKEEHEHISIFQLLKNGRYMLAVIASMLDSMSSSSLFIFLPFLLLQKGIASSILGSFAAAYFVGNFLGKSVIGRLVDRFGNARVFISAEILMAVFIVFLTITKSPVFIVIFSLMVGALTKGTVPARTSMGIDALEGHKRFEKAIGLSAFFITAGGSLAPLIYGRIADIWGINATFYTSACIALLAIIPAIVFSLVKK